MERFEDDRLLAELRELRPNPRPGFAAELDQRAAAGFPRRSRLDALRAWLRKPARRRKTRRAPRRTLLPACAAGLAVLAGAAVVVTISDSEPKPSGNVLRLSQPVDPRTSRISPEIESPSAGAMPDATEEDAASGAPAGAKSDAGAGVAAQARDRDVERSAELTLGTDPAGVADASARVFDAVHSHRGIVLSSSTREGEAGEAGAEFELLIPSARLGDALASLSAIAEVRSRQEATNDITAPTVGVGERLRDSRARIDSLLGQLAEAGSEGEREAVETELRGERRRAAALRSRLADLQRRANFARVFLRIQTGPDSSPSTGGSWSVDDALADAGRILAVAAGVALLGLAILAPVAIVALLAWLAQRSWVRRGRRRAPG